LNPQASHFGANEVVTLTAMPDAGQSFLVWSGDAIGTENPLRVVMDQSKIISASFTATPRFELGECASTSTASAFRLLLSGQLGKAYAIETSSNLVDWVSLAVLTNVAGLMQIEDPKMATATHRFYRALLAPESP
jgi:hypothetical protein